MIVYAETNFILELTLGQEQCTSCRQLVNWAQGRQLDLRLPAYAFYESRAAILLKQEVRSKLKDAIDTQVEELGRTVPFGEFMEAFAPARATLSNITITETALLEEIIGALAACSSDIPLDRTAALDVTVFRDLRLIKGDADLIIFSCIAADLEKRFAAGDVAPSIFVTRNSRDFGRDAKGFLRKYACDVFTSYDAAVGRLRALLP